MIYGESGSSVRESHRRRRICMPLPQVKQFCLIVSIILLTSIHIAYATTVIEKSFADLVAQAEVITVGTVSDIHEQWDAGQQVPLTLVTFSDLTALKGN